MLVGPLFGLDGLLEHLEVAPDERRFGSVVLEGLFPGLQFRSVERTHGRWTR